MMSNQPPFYIKYGVQLISDYDWNRDLIKYKVYLRTLSGENILLHEGEISAEQLAGEANE